MTTKTRAAALVLTLTTVTLGPSLATMSPADAAPAKYYSSCDKLHKDWPNGVAKSVAAANRTVRDGYNRPATSKKARAVYARNKAGRDRDKDGTACETT